MLTAIVVVFIVGYLMIALEHPLHINKAASALLLGVLCWTLYVADIQNLITPESIPGWFQEKVGHAAHSADAAAEASHSALELKREWLNEGQLLTALAEIASILFFLLGAMTIVEIVDAFEGFRIITDRINAKDERKLLWMISILTFFMSSVLDNLTTTIVMVSLLRKLVSDHDKRLLYVGMVVIAANAGGAWTVIGDVTTTMLWIKKEITPVPTMLWLFLPSIACLLVPLLLLSRKFKQDNTDEGGSAGLTGGENDRAVGHGLANGNGHGMKNLKPYQSTLLLVLGLAGLLFVPVFKAITHLPPFMGILLSLSVIWIVAELVKHDMDEVTRSSTHVLEILKRVDTSSLLFFLGILLAVSCLGATGILHNVAEWLDQQTGGNHYLIAVLIGLLSAIVDNVPLVAAGIEMYSMPPDDSFWQMLAYCAGTGGSCLIIGSAAGVAAMGLEKIDFIWYLRRISLYALAGYFAGVAVYLLQIGIANALG